ncbi:MAG: hypothetical protein M3179_05400 [Actinomycetota bacterium]|nr:hypothetical protein [Actinomycetota bacterium]
MTAETARKASTKTKSSARKATAKAGSAANKATTTARTSSRKAAGTAKATRAARAGRVKDAKKVVAEADLGDGMAERAISKMEERHYLVEVNKRGLSVTALTKTLNEQWDNGWRLAHILEQRGNTVLVYEKR